MKCKCESIQISLKGADRGAAMIEAAIVLPLFLLLLMGFLDFGHVLDQRARNLALIRENSRNAALVQDTLCPEGEEEGYSEGSNITSIDFPVGLDAEYGFVSGISVSTPTVLNCAVCSVLPQSLLASLPAHREISFPLPSSWSGCGTKK